MLILISGTLPVWADPGVVTMPPPDTPTLNLPVDQDTILVSELPVLLDWSDVADIGTYEAQVFFAEPVEGDEPIPFKSKVLIDSEFEIPTEELLDLLAEDSDSTFHWRVRAVNVDGPSDWSEVWEFTISQVNEPPTFNTDDPNFPIDGTEIDELALLEFSVTATDPEGGTITYAIDADSEAAGMSLDPETGAFSWMPTEEQGPGEFMVTFTATDDGNPAASVDTTISIFVLEVNSAPELTVISNVTTRPDTVLSFTAMATDADIPANELAFSLSGGEDGMEINPATGEFSWTPADTGQFVVTVIVTDNGMPPLSDSAEVSIVVTGNAPPVYNTEDPNFPVDGTEVDELVPLEFSVTATDPDGGTVTYAIDEDSEAAGMSLDPETGAFTWTPTEEQGPGEFMVTFTATDDGDPAASTDTTITIFVLEVNEAPVLTVNSNVSALPDEELTFTAIATDPDIPANELVFSLSGGEDGMEINPATGEFSWTPAETGEFVVTVIVTDNGMPPLSDSTQVTIQVSGNAPPTFNNNDPNFPVDGTEIDELATLEFSVTATDPEGGTVTYAIDEDSEAAGMSLDPETGAFLWVPTEEQGPGEFMVTFTATDDGDPAASTDTTITLFVLEVNVAPELTVNSNATTKPNEELTFTAMATDVDIPANELVFSLSGGEDGMEINPATGEFSWTPADTGQFVVTIIVTDNGVPALSDSATVTIQVSGNEPPTFNTDDLDFPADGSEIDELMALEFSVTATDPEGGNVTYALDAESIAAGMQFDGETGAFSWIPSEEQGPDSYQLTFTATDDGTPNTSRDTTITILVNEVNMAPVLDDIATQTAFPGDPITFTATASDGDIPENNLVFSLIDAQPGMEINPASGEFSWVMTEGGPFQVTVTVTDDGDLPLSDSQVVTIIAPPSAPQTLSLAFCSTESTSLLEWAAVPADGYLIEIDTDPGFPAPELTIQTGQTSIEAPLGGLKVNTVYYWRVAAEINGVRGAASTPLPFRRWPATIQLGHTLAFPKATESADFRMVSIPGQSQGISVASTFPGQTPLEDWRVYTDDAEDVAYPIYLQQVDSETGTGELFFRPGRGFWALSTSAWEVGAQDLPSVTLDASTSRFFEIPLFQGNSTVDARWTMIGNPFDFPVLWQDIVDANPITGDDVLWDWTSNGYVAATVLEPYKGYYFFNRDNNPTLQMPCYLEPADGAASEAAEEESMPLVLSLKSVTETGEESQSSVSIGWHDEAESNLDAHDRFMPPAFFESYRITLVNENLGTQYPYLDREFRPATDESQTFDLELKSVPGERSTFEVQGIESLDHAEVYLFDLVEGRSYDLRDNPIVSVEPEGEVSRYRLALGDASFIADQQDKLIPEVFTLKQSYPNPFVAQTTVEFSMPEQKFVELEVYNVLGQRVRTLLAEEKEVGFHRVVWDGTNDVGDPVASGIYMYVFRTDSFQKTQKLVRVR